MGGKTRGNDYHKKSTLHAEENNMRIFIRSEIESVLAKGRTICFFFFFFFFSAFSWKIPSIKQSSMLTDVA
jgi:hypothetical protein